MRIATAVSLGEAALMLIFLAAADPSTGTREPLRSEPWGAAAPGAGWPGRPHIATNDTLPTIPDSAGIPTRILATTHHHGGDAWYGTYGRGIFVRRAGAHAGDTLRHIANIANDSTSLSLDFVHAIAFGRRGEVWYGTVGNGWGVSEDDGKSWKNWTFSRLGPEWQYVVPDGIVVRGDTVVIATADGLQVTTDDGAHWTAFGDTVGPPAKGPADTVLQVLPNEYVIGLVAGPRGWTLGHLRGSTTLNMHGCLRRAHGDAHAPCVVRNVVAPRRSDPIGLLPADGPVRGSDKRWSPWFARPIASEDNDHIDQTYRWGSTMGGLFQAHQGVEFNNPDGTLVHAIGDGTVVYAGRAEQGALTVGIRHDTMLVVGDKRYVVFSTYYHNSALLVRVGDRVKRGGLISRVGHTGRATNDHMHLEVHAAPTDSVRLIIDSLNKYPRYTTNPELWITPLPGTGIVAGTVVNRDGQAIPQARVYGVVKPVPRETPFAFAETYGPRNHPHPAFGEHFAISDVPAGEHHLFVVIDGRRVERDVTVKAGAMSWVEFRP
jgi:murein DD-endopeptidase MepM/ murein hydrolase activator NlpD